MTPRVSIRDAKPPKAAAGGPEREAAATVGGAADAPTVKPMASAAIAVSRKAERSRLRLIRMIASRLWPGDRDCAARTGAVRVEQEPADLCQAGRSVRGNGEPHLVGAGPARTDDPRRRAVELVRLRGRDGQSQFIARAAGEPDRGRGGIGD